jgi:hypothetical protein
MQRYAESACGKPAHAGKGGDDADDEKNDEQPEVETTTP